MTPEEAAIFGDDAIEALAAADALRFSLQDATGKPVPRAEVLSLQRPSPRAPCPQ